MIEYLKTKKGYFYKFKKMWNTKLQQYNEDEYNKDQIL